MSPALASSCGNNLERALEFARWSGTAPLPITALRRQLYACGLQLYAYACAPPLVDISDVPGRGGGATQPSRAWPPARLSVLPAALVAGRRGSIAVPAACCRCSAEHERAPGPGSAGCRCRCCPAEAVRS